MGKVIQFPVQQIQKQPLAKEVPDPVLALSQVMWITVGWPFALGLNLWLRSIEACISRPSSATQDMTLITRRLPEEVTPITLARAKHISSSSTSGSPKIRGGDKEW